MRVLHHFLLLFCLLFVLKTNAQNIDISTLEHINLKRNQSLDATFIFISNTATPVCLIAPISLYSTGLILKSNSIQNKGILVGSSLTLCTILAYSGKYTIKRKRPYVTYPQIENIVSTSPYSFPSGRTSTAFSTATSLSMAFPKWYVIAPSYAWASSVAYSRMHLGAHYPSDVLVGAIIGSASAFLCYKGQQWISGKKKN